MLKHYCLIPCYLTKQKQWKYILVFTVKIECDRPHFQDARNSCSNILGIVSIFYGFVLTLGLITVDAGRKDEGEKPVT